MRESGKNRSMKAEKVICGECGRDAFLVSGADIYPHRPDLYRLKFWKCECGAYVGCHRGRRARPLGTPAGAGTRGLRHMVHGEFDVIWKSGKMTRNEAYGWLADKLGIEREKCHVGMFDSDRCREVLGILSREDLMKGENDE